MKILLAGILFGLLGGTGFSQERDVPERVLFVGNSYTAGIKRELVALFSASEHRGVEFEFIHPGGCTLERHLGNAKTVAKIREGKWDVVVLQEQSQMPAYPGLREKFLAGAKGLDAVIKESGARAYFYQTWGRRDGDKQNARLAADYVTMQRLLTEGYAAAEEGTGGEVVAVGEAWKQVWEADEDLAKSLYVKDGSHPSKAGAYLAACVFYRNLTGEDPGEVRYDAGLPEAAVRVLRESAAE